MPCDVPRAIPNFIYIYVKGPWQNVEFFPFPRMSNAELLTLNEYINRKLLEE